MRLIYLSLSWIAGIYLGEWSGYPWVAISALAVATLLAIPLRRPRALLLALCLIFFLGGILRIQSTIPIVSEDALRFYNDRGTVQIQGLVADDPEPSDSTVALKISAGEIEIDGEWKEVSGTVLVYAPNLPSSGEPRDFPYYRYGDLLSIEGTLQTPPVLEDFDYREYLARKGIHSIMHYPAGIELIAEGQGAKPQEWLYALRNRMSRSLDSALHEPQGSLAQAILLGKRSTIPDETKDSFAETGTSHLLAISGLHVGILAGLTLSIGVWIFGRRRPTYFILALIAVWGYALLSGLHAPVLRASIMGSLWLFADYIGRPNSALTSLLFAAALMLGIHPSILGEISFQLSFAAMAGLVLLTPRFQSLGRRLLGDAAGSRRSVSFVITSLSITLGAVLATLPITAYYFHKISLVALPANFFAL
ncbi:ComEC/Rec2 family competence protein, partial [Chloroflexota bacterium]